MVVQRIKLIRHRTRENAGSRTLFFTTEFIGRKGHADFFRPHQVPAFEGESAWFEAERAPKVGWRILRRVTEQGEPCEDDPPRGDGGIST
jgi:hypothetical protein